ncbi:EAL domain-containing protein [Stutzerimonas nitrititolerans]|uniref:EAL domain-containing protein n=1 Tax=Stutzerimonas nitrititolerans TaxID=2482751 RepID=UPI002896866E|nr:EAL domain-containing protein [Stutzerimonas nitrititolerans]
MFKNTDILVVEDSPTQALELQLLLEAAGCQVRVARNGVEALAMVAAKHPTLVISDIVMPEMDGYELCRQLKHASQTAYIPLILVTRLGNARDVVHGLSAGADNFIVKPYDEQYLLSRIRYFLVNLELRTHERMQMGVEIMLEGERHFITADRQQIFDLLISTYEQGIRLNQQLQSKHDEILQSNRLVECMFRFTARLSDARSKQQVIDSALQQILTFPGAAGAWLLLESHALPDQPPTLVGTCGRGLEQLDERLNNCGSACECVTAWQRGELMEPVNIPCCVLLDEHPTTTAHISIPLMLGERTIGVFNVLYQPDQVWSEEALSALTSIGQQLAMALGRARLLESMEKEIQLRTQELLRSESLLRGVVDDLPVGVLVADCDAKVILSNRESGRIWNSSEPLQTADPACFQGAWAETGQRIEDADWPLIQALQQGKTLRNQVLDIRAFDGAEKTIVATAVPFDGQRSNQGAIAILQDISEQRKRDLEMRMLTRAVDVSVNAVVITDNKRFDQPIIYVNPAFVQLTGYSRDEVIGKNCRFLLGHYQDQPELANIRRALEGKQRGSAVLLNCRKDGSQFWNELSITPVTNDRNEVTHYVGILHDITEAKRYREELEHQANHDSLTDLANRNLLRDRLQLAIALASHSRQAFAVVLIDLDRFKVINDSLGHGAGDHLLKLIAERLRQCAREIDTVARLGGDEFVIVSGSSCAPGELISGLEQLKASITEPLILNGQEVVISASIGFCCYPVDGEDADTLLRNADTAMYRAKQQGRNRICAFTSEMNEQIQKRLRLEQDIRLALQQQQFRVVYQPQLDLESGRLCGFEALVRWQRDGETIPPNEFVPLAEETGQIVAIDFQVLDSVCQQLKNWLDAIRIVRVAMNVSAITLMDPSFVDQVTSTLNRYQLPPGQLKLEITETILIDSTDQALEKMNTLSALGIHFAIDDFGIGYSSLGYLKRFPFSQLKIDQSFIQDVHLDPDAAALVRSMISIGHGLGIKVIAEGVETIEQLSFLHRAGCDEVQGYYYSRPLPPGDCLTFLTHNLKQRLPANILAEQQRYLLVVDDEQSILNALKRELRLENYQVLAAASPQEALELLATHPVDVVLTDLRLSQVSGVQLLGKIRSLHPDVVRIVLSASTEVSSILKAVNEGVIYRFITKPWEADDLRAQIREAFQQRKLLRENMRMRSQLARSDMPISM